MYLWNRYQFLLELLITGCNAAYMENAGAIPKLADLNLPPDMPMAINCEW